jgi:heat shock protein HtpX
MYSQITSNKRKTALLIALFSAFIIGIGYAMNVVFGYGYEAVVGAVVLSTLMSLVSYFHADKIALWSTGAKPIQKDDNPYLWRIVENLAIANGMPMPKVHVIDSPALNAFATGRNPGHASIAVTTGLMQSLENEELEGVIAHELSHVKNYDILVMTIVVVLVGTIALLGDFFFRIQLHRNNDRKVHPMFMVIGLLLLILSPIVAELIKLAISRKREFLADASGALLTRYPEGLARALEKISGSPPLQTASAATAHLFIANPLQGRAMSNLFSTHPPIAERIKRLREAV